MPSNHPPKNISGKNILGENILTVSQAESWLSAFAAGVDHASLFTEDAIWRDYLAFEWDLKTYEGGSDILNALSGQTTNNATLADILSKTEFVFHCNGPNGAIKALVELQNGLCVRLFTSLEAPHSHSDFETASKASHQGEKQKPFIVIIGAGQSGLALAAQLQNMNIPYEVIEQNTRIGDNWRHRYDSLVLHDPVWVNHLPFKPFPEDWPVFTPKDMMGDWLEDYASTLDLNVTCGTSVQSAQFDEHQSLWDISLSRDGEIRQVQAAHLVFAVGTSGFAHKPDFTGSDLFSGEQMHSSAYKTGSGYKDKDIVIIGATNSAHDIAVDLVKHGGRPTLIQRSSTHVVPHKVYLEDILAPLYAPEQNRAVADSDFLSIATPMRSLEKRGKAIFDKAKQDWSTFYGSLTKIGFTLDFAEDGSGIIGKYRRSASGYYIDVGGSQRVIDGHIAVKSGFGVEAIVEDGVLLSDGTTLKADAIIYATGFGSMEEWVSKLIDKETADKIGKCWGYGSGYRGDPGPWEGELRNMWKPTAQQGLWFMGGNLAQVRIYSRYLAMQLLHQYQKTDN